jgi:pimeloyl-ACP methyl ester carboxylesterase
MGGGIALQAAVRYPDVVHKLIFASGASYQPDGFYPQLTEGEKTMKGEDLAGSPFERDYLKVAPHAQDWTKLVEKVKRLDLAWRGVPSDAVRSIKTPTLLIIGDSDVVRPEHTVEMFRLLGGGVPGDLVGLPRAQLAVLPGTTHVTLTQRVDWLASMVVGFLDASSRLLKRLLVNDCPQRSVGLRRLVEARCGVPCRGRLPRAASLIT